MHIKGFVKRMKNNKLNFEEKSKKTLEKTQLHPKMMKYVLAGFLLMNLGKQTRNTLIC